MERFLGGKSEEKKEKGYKRRSKPKITRKLPKKSEAKEYVRNSSGTFLLGFDDESRSWADFHPGRRGKPSP
jgi:hypothetical protein